MDSFGSWEALESKPGMEHIRVGEVELRPGDRVVLRPLRGSDIFDIALAGKTATIESIMQDYEDRVYVVVTVDDDPGKDFGLERKPAHRFFFSPFEIEPLLGGEGRAG
jgi:hypothetical protein